MTDAPARLGRADLHIHTLASDGTAGIEAILDHVERLTDLDVIAITDHERIDAAVAAQAIARDRGLRADVVVGEEVTTLGGHLLALYLDRPIRPYRSLRTTILAVHEAGGLAIPAHPLVPYPALCARAGCCAACSTTPIRPPTPTVSRRSTRPASASRGIAASSASPTTTGWPMSATATPTRSRRSGSGWTTFPGRDAADLRRAIETRTTEHGGVLPRDGRPARHVRPPAAQARP